MNQYSGNSITHAQGVRLVNKIPAFHEEVDINTTDRCGFKAAKKAAKKQM